MFTELVKKNRSYRRFKEDKRPGKKQLLALVELARFAPCAANLQALRFSLVHTKKECDLLFPSLKWAGYLRYWDGPAPGERPAAYIVILAPANSTRFHHTDAGIAAQTMMLGAVEQGLGGCIIAALDAEKIRQDLKLPAELDILLVLALGFPAEKVVIEDVTDPEDIEYWRDDDSVHHVPKRKLEDLMV